MERYVGKRLDGRYEIHELIGAGGMACVYKAYDRQENRWVAIKILKDEYSQNSEFLRRFRNESRAIAVLSHPNIVKIYDVSFGDRIQYIVMEYVDGITLKDYIQHNGALPWKESVHFTSQVLRALQHAHDNGIIHRDVKPQNIMLLQDGTIKVTDFGIARFNQGETQTMTDKALGSVHYIAPEQARGEHTSERTDIYSVGVLLYEMITGKLPFVADTAVSVALMQLQSEPKLPTAVNPDVPGGLEEITMKAMKKNPAERFSSAGEMLRDLNRFKANPAIVFAYAKAQDLSSTRFVDISAAPIPGSKKRGSAPSYRDNYEYEEEMIHSTRKAKGSMIIMGIIIAILVAVVAFGGFFIYDILTTPPEEDNDEIKMPSFIGLNYEEDIKNNKKYEDFVFTITVGNDESKGSGEVIAQNPSAGIEVKKGKEVFLTVNMYEKSDIPIIVEDVVGDSQTDAYNKLKAAGLTPSLQGVYNNDVAASYVVGTEPKAGETLFEGDTVIVYVSRGPQETPIAVPDVEDMSLERAKLLIEQVGLKVGDITYDEKSDKERDTVLECNPKIGKRVTKDTKINLKVSAGKNHEKEVEVKFELPPNVKKDVQMKIYIGGVLDTEKIVNPLYTKEYETTYKGITGEKSVVVQINGQDYMVGTIVFDEARFTLTHYIEYIEPTPTPTPTPPVSSEPENSESSGENGSETVPVG